eukprot:71204-Karenia_brevis.AAC.1
MRSNRALRQLSIARVWSGSGQCTLQSDYDSRCVGSMSLQLDTKLQKDKRKSQMACPALLLKVVIPTERDPQNIIQPSKHGAQINKAVTDPLFQRKKALNPGLARQGRFLIESLGHGCNIP